MKRFKYSLLASTMAFMTAGTSAATYQVVDLTEQSNSSRHSYGLAVNDAGDALGNLTELYNYPVNIERLNMTLVESALASAQAAEPGVYDDVTLEDIEAGNLNAQAVAFLRNYLAGGWLNRDMQKVGDRTSFISNASGYSEVTMFDEVQDGFGGKTRSTTDIPYAINDNGVIVGAGTDVYRFTQYSPAPTDDIPEPEDLTFWRNTFVDRQGVVINGSQKVVVPSEFIGFGGSTVLNDISNNNYVVGYAAVQVSRDASLGIDGLCPDEEDTDRMLQCAWQVRNNMLSQSSSQAFFRYRAYRWKFDENFEIVETKNLGLMFESDNTESISYFSAATGVNEQGYMSGVSHGYRNHPDNSGGIRTMATFHDGESYKAIIDQDTYFSSRATDINDNNIVVGYAARPVNSTSTNQIFYYDHNTGETVYPEGFFDSSVSEPAAINNLDQIVGTAQVQTDLIQNRRSAGFIYDINAQTMTNLNDLTACNSPYRVVEAKDINDDGVIVGTALLSVNKKDALGEDLLDDSGNPIEEQVARAIKLIPVAGGSIDDCTDDGNSGQGPVSYERKGAGFGFISLFLLGGIYCRRKQVR